MNLLFLFDVFIAIGTSLEASDLETYMDAAKRKHFNTWYRTYIKLLIFVIIVCIFIECSCVLY